LQGAWRASAMLGRGEDRMFHRPLRLWIDVALRLTLRRG